MLSPAADDHVLEPPGDLNEARLVHAAQVAHMQPVGGVDRLPRRIRHPVVLDHVLVATAADLALLAHWQRVTVTGSATLTSRSGRGCSTVSAWSCGGFPGRSRTPRA